MYKNKIGVIYQLKELLQDDAKRLLSIGIDCVQIQNWDMDLLTKENAERVRTLLDGKMHISSFWAGWTGPQFWNFTEGPQSLGLVPEVYRAERLNELKKGADFAAWLGVKNMATHVGFIPENPSTTECNGLYVVLKEIVEYCRQKGLNFNFETGQETPVTLMRMITKLSGDNVGINLDPANLIMYGKGNPVDALDLFKGYVRGVHIKDGDYPTDFNSLGQERVVGEGTVNFPVFLPKLIRSGYDGDLYIEREIGGEQQMVDIKKTIKFVQNILQQVDKE